MVEEDAPISERTDKVRRSIFLSQELEASLARLAEERGTTANDLICDILTRAVATAQGTTDEKAE